MLVEVVCYNYHILYGKFSPNLANSMKMSAWADVIEKYEKKSATLIKSAFTLTRSVGSDAKLMFRRLLFRASIISIWLKNDWEFPCNLQPLIRNFP